MCVCGGGGIPRLSDVWSACTAAINQLRTISIPVYHPLIARSLLQPLRSITCHLHSHSSLCLPITIQSLPPRLPLNPLTCPQFPKNVMIWDILSKEWGFSLPPHCPYDCAINRLPGASLPTSQLHNLSRPEWESMEKYINDSFAARIIWPSSSPVGTGFFFVMKKDSCLHPCIDYQGLNITTVKNKYPLPWSTSHSSLFMEPQYSPNWT